MTVLELNVETTNQTSSPLDAPSERYTAYSYSYPHKTAYRTFDVPIRISDLWKHEKKDALFLYMHIPFCEMRCGFCNLFTTTNPASSMESEYLDALERQAERVKRALDGDESESAKFARMAIGGGTPTYLEPAELKRMFDISSKLFGIDCHEIPTSIETSPLTTDRARLTVLRERGIERVSIGIQSFVESEVMAVGRSQKNDQVHTALETIKEFNFPVLNIDLIYGLPGQTEETFVDSILAALKYQPEEIYLYPLYVRPLTGLARTGRSWDDERVDLYRIGRDFLQYQGYEQVSMRMFQRKNRAASSGPIYCCQNDGMIGLGCGARSYTTDVHYSMKYAVGKESVRGILNDYISTDSDSFDFTTHGARLTLDEQKRRFIIQSLLLAEGLSLSQYESRFGTNPLHDFPSEFENLARRRFIFDGPDQIKLTGLGLEWSDRIGHDFYSQNVRALMDQNKSQ